MLNIYCSFKKNQNLIGSCSYVIHLTFFPFSVYVILN